jgi:nucleoside-triphosphatase
VGKRRDSPFGLRYSLAGAEFVMRLFDASQRVLLTGRPGCGKTTLLKRVLDELPQRFGGFYTGEIRDQGSRVGFKVVALEGGDAVFAHVDFATPQRVGKYGLDLSAFEAVGVNAIREAVRARRPIAIDEIGPMEIRSTVFREAVNNAFDSELPILATIFSRYLPFTDGIKSRPDVMLIEISPDNRDRLVSQLSEKFRT